MKNNNGITFIELILSISVSSLLIIAIGGVFITYMRSNMKMKELITLRRQFAYANQLLERDIRMAGFNLPGNGIVVDFDDPENHAMYLLKNEESLQTKLSQKADSGDNFVLVMDVNGSVSIDDWVCLSDLQSGITEYLQIIGGPQFSGSYYIVSFGSEVLKNTWNSINTDVYFAKAVKYLVDGTEPDAAFIRSTPQKKFKISKDIKKFVITPRDSIGVDLTDLIPFRSIDIRRVGIELIKPVPENTDNPISSTIEVSIRNYL